MDLIIATKNGHKIREIRFFLRHLKQFDIYSLADFPDYTPPPETGSTFEENATLKAVHAAHALNKWALADDSGLVVPSLKGAPGVYSARYSGPHASDKDNRAKLLKEMEKIEGEARSAYFECCLALASPNKIQKVTRGLCEGIIAEKGRGGNGFGYDPLFIKYGYHQTFAQLGETVKNHISHRAKALEKMLLILETQG